MQMIRQAAPLAIIVDDEPDIRKFVSIIAAEAGFAVETAAHGGELLQVLGNRSPAVVVLDLHMSQSDGIQVMNELATHHVATKIVIFSGSDQRILETSADIARQRGLTVSAILQKPTRRAELFQVLRQLNLESAPFSPATLRTCLDERRLTLHYQPKISLPTFDVVGCEALLRCTDPAGRAVSPELVISTAEDAGLVDDITEWVLQEAVEQRRLWSEQGLPLGIAVNLSARSSFNRDLPEMFATLCHDQHVPCDAVTVELTESAVMNDQLLGMEAIVRFRLKGFKLSIDDFGTGYSSLLRLKQLPFTEIKVDKSFVTTMHASRDNAIIVKAIIQLAQSMEMHSVIEGVEDQQALDFVTGLGCNEVQGYFVSRPTVGSDIPGFVKAWQWRKHGMYRHSDQTQPRVEGTDHQETPVEHHR